MLPTLDEINAFLHERIPVTKAMSIEIRDISTGSISATAPLKTNTNHHDTFFGGSLSTLGIVSGWSLVWSAVKDWSLRKRIVIQDSQTRFIRPADSDAMASTMPIRSEEWQRFRHAAHNAGKSSLEVDTEIFCEGRRIAVHSGLYVVLAPESDCVARPDFTL